MSMYLLELKELGKSYNDKYAVQNVSLYIHPGAITGFLGPNGAGKTTCMKMILGLVTPTSGNVYINGKPYSKLSNPLHKIGALIDANSIDERLSPKQYLSIIATASGIGRAKVDEVIRVVGLFDVRDNKLASFSLGMKQRVGIAAALLGNPEIFILDEPFNGLDIDGIKWLRKLLRELAGQGTAVIISSHLLSEIQAIADRIVLLAQGSLIADMTMEQMREMSLCAYIKVRANDMRKLKKILLENGALFMQENQDHLGVQHLTAEQIGDIAFTSDIRIYELTQIEPSLEQMYSELVGEKVDYRGAI